MATKYSIQKESAYSADSDTINDSIGRVWYTYKANVKISINLASGDVKTPSNQIIKKVYIPKPTSSRCFYNDYVKNTYYILPYQVKEKKEPSYNTITNPTANVHGIKLDTDLYTLEIRNNDPWVLTGIDSAPFEFFQSIAITKNEVNVIKALLIQENILSASITYKLESKEERRKNLEERKYYKIKLKIIGSKNGTTGITQANVDTGINLYSVDQINWISAAYASEALSEIDSPWVWDNGIIPNPIGDNPFITSTTNCWENSQKTGLKDRLDTIIKQADNLPVANDKKGYRLLDTAIRDYIYQGDIDKVTFEMAFRLPFYIEKIKDTPYTTVNGRFNNPYYTKFDQWFGYANGVRELAGYNLGMLLSRAGHRESFTTSIQMAQDHIKLYNIFGLKKNNNISFINRRVPAYMAQIMEDENPFSTYYTKHKDIIHFPAIILSTKMEYKVPDHGATLSLVLTHLENIGIISSENNHETKDFFLTGPVNCFKEILNPSSTNGFYLVKNSSSSLFVIKDVSINKKDKGRIVPDLNNNSGWTIGMGYDVGQNNKFSAFLTYSEFEFNDTTEESIYKEAMGKSKAKAAALYESYKSTVIPKYELPYDTAVKNTMPLMRNSYLKGGIDKLGSKSYFPLLNLINKYFYNPNIPQYLNEVEKMIFLTQIWNAGTGPLAKSERSKFLVHAYNTHDYRWLKYFVSKEKTKGLSVYPSRKAAIKQLMNLPTIFNHYKINQTSL